MRQKLISLQMIYPWLLEARQERDYRRAYYETTEFDIKTIQVKKSVLSNSGLEITIELIEHFVPSGKEKREIVWTGSVPSIQVITGVDDTGSDATLLLIGHAIAPLHIVVNKESLPRKFQKRWWN